MSAAVGVTAAVGVFLVDEQFREPMREAADAVQDARAMILPTEHAISISRALRLQEKLIETLRNALGAKLDGALDRELEASLAFEHATQIIEGSCRPVGEEEDNCRDWWDTVCVDELAAEDVVRVRGYLESRGLIEVHASNPTWIALKDEHEAAA